MKEASEKAATMDIPGARPAQEVDTNGLYHLCPFGGPVGESVDRPVVVRTFQTVLTTCHPKRRGRPL